MMKRACIAVAVELGVVVLVKQEQLDDAGRKTRDTPKLTGIDRVNDVHDLGRRDAYDIASKAGVGHVARVPAQDVVGHATPDCNGLDPLPDGVTPGR
jgi:hypothetical protein